MSIFRWLIALVVVVITIASLGSAKFLQIKSAMAMAESFPEPSATVNSTLSESQSFQSTTQTTGQVRAPQWLQLRSELSGRITAVNYQPGETVKQGQTLITIDDRQEKAQLKAALARHELALKTVKRLKQLKRESRVSQEQLDTARAELSLRQSEVTELRTLISKKRIVAPFDGVVGLDKFETGQYLDMGTQITTLVGVNEKLWVDFKLPQTQGELAIGSKIDLKTITTNPALSQSVEATVIVKSALVESNSRHIQYRAEFDSNELSVQHNSLVSLVVPQGMPQSMIVVPASAVSRDAVAEYVYVLNKDDKGQLRAERRKVILGAQQGEQQYVITGLNSAERVATEGSFKLHQGLLVYTQENNTAELSYAGGK